LLIYDGKYSEPSIQNSDTCYKRDKRILYEKKKALKTDVRMVDFAHTSFDNDDYTIDNNYLFGLKNLIKMLEDIIEPTTAREPSIPKAFSKREKTRMILNRFGKRDKGDDEYEDDSEEDDEQDERWKAVMVKNMKKIYSEIEDDRERGKRLMFLALAFGMDERIGEDEEFLKLDETNLFSIISQKLIQ